MARAWSPIGARIRSLLYDAEELAEIFVSSATEGFEPSSRN